MMKKISTAFLQSVVVLIGIVVLAILIFHSKDDDPAGFIAICILTTFASLVVATAAAIFEKKLKNAVAVQFELDSTV